MARLAPFERSKGNGKLGTFAGVFTPSILTILGIILFLRTGYVVGRGGLLQALLIMAMAHAIAILTSLSLAAVATNMRVRGGGDYYLISRTLGVEFGGAIGVVLFLAQSISVAFYCIGFGEAVVAVAPPDWGLGVPMVAAAAIVFLSVFAWIGADWASKLQFLILGVLAVALGSFFWGGISAFDAERLAENLGPMEGAQFWILFALFFPAVTGFTQGVSMSGDLRDPGRSLPLGTFAAVGVSLVVYALAALLFAGALPAQELGGRYDAMNAVATQAWLVSAGVIAATLSSGMASFMGAPRILQALAADDIFPPLRPFAKGQGEDNNPRRGVLLTMALALVVVKLANLNLVAPVIAMFFLISYGLLNYATYYEAKSSSPAFRPRFRFFDRRLSLLGALGCVAAMLAINPLAATFSGVVMLAIYHYLKALPRSSSWADSTRAHAFQRIREHLFEIAGEAPHPRDWRPQILIFSRDAERRPSLLNFSSWIEGGSGLSTLVSILEDDEGDRKSLEEDLAESIEECEVQVFPLVLRAPNLSVGLEGLIQAYGIGPLKANIALLNWFEAHPWVDEDATRRRFGRHVSEVARLGMNIVALHAEEGRVQELVDRPGEERRIDIWWSGEATGQLMIMLAYLMTRTRVWQNATLRILAQGARDHPERTRSRFDEHLEEFRIMASVEVIEELSLETILEASGDADAVFLPLELKGEGPSQVLGQPLEELLDKLPMSALMLASEDIDLDAEVDDEEAEVTDAEHVEETATGRDED